MTYPTQAELAEMVREAAAPDSLALARVALRLGVSWPEINEIRVYGVVSRQTAAFWEMVRANA